MYIGRKYLPLPYHFSLPSSFFSVTDFYRTDTFSDVTTYAPPVADVQMLYDGAIQYACKRFAISDPEYEILLRWLTMEYGKYLVADKIGKVKAVELLEPEKAVGLPWRTRVGPKKSDFLDCFDSSEDVFDFCLEYFSTQVSVFSSTIKDELRPIGKKGRFFTPAPIELIVVGNWLFEQQKQNVMLAVGHQPICIGLQMPGAPLTNVYRSLASFSNKFVSFDASKWDASCPLFAFQLCRDLRNLCNPGDAVFVDRYYNQVYTGLTSVDGEVTSLHGQKSGQTLTSFDNSIALSALFMLHAIRRGLTFAQFKSQVRYYVYGDDLIYSARSDVFQATDVAATFRSVGVYLESPHSGFCDMMESTFLGTTPVWREFRGMTFLVPLFRKEKLMSSLAWARKGLGDIDFFQKLIAIYCLVFGDKELFDQLREDILVWFKARPELMDCNIEGLLIYLLDPMNVFVLHTGAESRCAIPRISFF